MIGRTGILCGLAVRAFVWQMRGIGFESHWGRFPFLPIRVFQKNIYNIFNNQLNCGTWNGGFCGCIGLGGFAGGSGGGFGRFGRRFGGIGGGFGGFGGLSGS